MPRCRWLEITNRPDIGADLWAPETYEGENRSYWGYALIRHIQPGDVILHYHQTHTSIVAYSFAAGIAQVTDVEWTPHSSSARNTRIGPNRRPGWSLALKGTTPLRSPLPLEAKAQ
jgi:hypothetical protein